MLFTTGAGVIMSLLVAVRGLTGGYLVHAEKIGWAWLGEGEDGDAGKGKKKGDEVVVVVSEWGEKIIGTVVLRLVKKERRAYVKAWTTGLKYRGKGIGRGLLEEGVRVAAERGCRGVEFDDDHASKFWSFPFFSLSFPPPPFFFFHFSFFLFFIFSIFHFFSCSLFLFCSRPVTNQRVVPSSPCPLNPIKPSP